ncbi:multidrug resistance-associated ABC transporter [Sanghuangporus baumii]|uniref:Multidrug resistance-associated ABC transporter n=1 Tax=Sanghuangporus baumii TaxID=108892 RepID=A0A9Q5HV80_SANBA|nr:multidrug resistance-associated ABC transporter [Sanghuangporus baumii]
MPRLRVLAGPSPNSLRPICANTNKPHAINSEVFEGLVVVHIKGFPDEQGNVLESEYFDRPDRQGVTWSIQVQGRFLQPYSADDILFGNTFDRPLKLPWGSSAALKFMNFIDPTLEHDLTGQQPWALSPLVSTMPHLTYSPRSKIPPSFPPRQSIGDDDSLLFRPNPSASPATSPSSSEDSLPGNRRESKKSKSRNPAKSRRSHFSRTENRHAVTFGPDDVLTTDFCYGFITFPELALCLPGGISFDLAKYWDGQPLWLKKGRVYLPLDEENDALLNGRSEADDPFGVTKPEDVVDGDPVQEKEFWESIRRCKWILLVIMVALGLLQVGCLVRNIVVDGWGRGALSSVLQAIYTPYAVMLSIFAVWHPASSWHGRLAVHLSALSTLAFFTLSALVVLPSDAVADMQQRIFRYTSLVLWALAFSISVRMKRGPALHFPLERIYLNKLHARMLTFSSETQNVCGMVGASLCETLLFSYTTKVVKLGYSSEALAITDLPILPGEIRASTIFAHMKATCRKYRLRHARPGSGWQLAYQLLRANGKGFVLFISGVLVISVLFYGPMLFMQRLVAYLESDLEERDPAWGWIYGVGLFMSSIVLALVIEQIWSLALTNLQVKIRMQLNTLLFAKTLVRKDVTSVVVSSEKATKSDSKVSAEEDFSSKAQIMTLMTTDADRVAEFVWHFYTLIDSPAEITIGALFLYKLLGISGLIGLAVACLFLPINNYAGRIIVRVQERLMRVRDERVTIMNEVLGAMRMLKFMAWERNFEYRIMKIREQELKYQFSTYKIQLLFVTIWNISPLLVTLVAFWHFTVVRGQALTPSVAFTSIAIFSKLKFALNAIPGTMVNTLQSFVSIRRIEKYLCSPEVDSVNILDNAQSPIALKSATVGWPQERKENQESTPSVSLTPHRAFSLVDVTLDFPPGKLSLICGKLGSGKTLLLQTLLGEADVLAGIVKCPRSPPNAMATFSDVAPSPEDWIVNGTCAYVPQTSWLQNASIKDNILFNLPYVEDRYRKTIDACALVEDLAILEDGDQTEVGERGINLSGGQKARISLARAIYSRASVLLLDDVLSAVDVHTAHHLFHECLRDELVHGRTIILVSHHVQLCLDGAEYVVALDNGRTWFSGNPEDFRSSGVMDQLIQDSHVVTPEGVNKGKVEKGFPFNSSSSTTIDAPAKTGQITSDSKSKHPPLTKKASSLLENKTPRKLVEEEKRAVGNIGKDVWKTYFSAVGGVPYWIIFASSIILAAAGPVAENGWLSYWSRLVQNHSDTRGALHYIFIYALITLVGLVTSTLRWTVLYNGSINASAAIYKKLLESVLFAPIRFHDTISRGRLLNRFGKDMEVIDSSLPDDFGNTAIYFTSACVTLITIAYVGGPRFIAAAFVLGFLYYEVTKVYSRCCRDLRRLDSVSRSPLYSIYEETISGAPVLRAFGAGSKFMRDMICFLDISTNPYFWLWKVNRWVSTRINLLSSMIVAVTAVIALVNPDIDASLAGYTLVFATTVTQDVAVERVKEYSDLIKEGPEFTEPKPPASWPSKGAVECKGLTIRYAPDLPDVLRDLSFKVNPGEKVGIVGRTEDPIIFSGTLRSTLDVFDEHIDAELYEALRRVHLIPSATERVADDAANENIFCNLESRISEGGDNLSAGQKQLLCLARAILKHSKLLVMDEATASVDYATDELIGKTITNEFADSTIFTIAHRLRTVIGYSRVMVLDQGRIVEFDRPAALLARPSSHFYALCEAQGKEEFSVLKKLARVT